MVEFDGSLFTLKEDSDIKGVLDAFSKKELRALPHPRVQRVPTYSNDGQSGEKSINKNPIANN